MMMKLRLFSLLLLLFGCARVANAQWHYLADNIYGDSVRIFEREANPKATNDPQRAFVAGPTAFRVANGDTLFIAKADSGFIFSNYTIHEEKNYKESWVPGAGNREFMGFATVTIDGKKYLVRRPDLVLAENGGESDWVNAKGGNHSELAHWYGTYTPYLLTLLCLVLAILFAYMSTILEPLVYLTPLMLIGAMVLEGLAIYALGDEALWILDMKQFGIGTAAWRGLLLFIASFLQFFSVVVMAGGPDSGLNYMAPLKFFLIALVVVVVILMIDGMFIHDGTWIPTIAVVLLVAAVVAGIALNLAQNIGALGVVGGIFFSLFIVIWTVSIVVLAVLLLMGFFSYFFDMLLFFASFGIAMGFIGKLVPITTFVRNGVLYKVYEK